MFLYSVFFYLFVNQLCGCYTSIKLICYKQDETAVQVPTRTPHTVLLLAAVSVLWTCYVTWLRVWAKPGNHVNSTLHWLMTTITTYTPRWLPAVQAHSGSQCVTYSGTTWYWTTQSVAKRNLTTGVSAGFHTNQWLLANTAGRRELLQYWNYNIQLLCCCFSEIYQRAFSNGMKDRLCFWYAKNVRSQQTWSQTILLGK